MTQVDAKRQLDPGLRRDDGDIRRRNALRIPGPTKNKMFFVGEFSGPAGTPKTGFAGFPPSLIGPHEIKKFRG